MPPRSRRSTTFVAGPSLSASRGDPAAATARRAVGLEFLREPLEVPIGIPWRWDGTSYENLRKPYENLRKPYENLWKPHEILWKIYDMVKTMRIQVAQETLSSQKLVKFGGKAMV